MCRAVHSISSFGLNLRSLLKFSKLNCWNRGSSCIQKAIDAEKLSIVEKARSIDPVKQENPLLRVPSDTIWSIFSPIRRSSADACSVRSQSWFCAEYRYATVRQPLANL